MIRIINLGFGYRIQECVTKDGLYVEWPELFSSIESAERHLKNLGVIVYEYVGYFQGTNSG